MLQSIINKTGIYADSVETPVSAQRVINSYYGFNVTKIEREPLDQIHAFLVARRIQDHNIQMYGDRGQFFPFIAGAFEALHQKNLPKVHESLERNGKKDQYKKGLFERIMTRLGIQGQVFLTQDFWLQQEYWACFQSLFESEMFSKEALIEDVLRTVYKDLKREDALPMIAGKIKLRDLPRELILVNHELLEQIGDWPADILYTPAEVAESSFLRRTRGVNLKIGPSKERTYDKYIAQFMDILHLKQPTSLSSRRLSPVTVTPYIAKKGNHIRLFFEDSLEDIEAKVHPLVPEQYAFTIDDLCGAVLNPFVEKMVFVVEAADAMGKTPLIIGGVEMFSGIDVINYITNGGDVNVLKKVLPELCFAYLVSPFSST